MKNQKANVELTEDQFLKRFTMISNHINSQAGWARDYAGGCLFDVTGAELEYVNRFDPRKIWTLLETDNGEIQVRSGYYCSNRVGFLLTIEPVEENVTFFVRLPRNQK